MILLTLSSAWEERANAAIASALKESWMMNERVVRWSASLSLCFSGCFMFLTPTGNSWNPSSPPYCFFFQNWSAPKIKKTLWPISHNFWKSNSYTSLTVLKKLPEICFKSPFVFFKILLFSFEYPFYFLLNFFLNPFIFFWDPFTSLKSFHFL